MVLRPDTLQIFSGESITVFCEIEEGQITDWKYSWRLDGNLTRTDRVYSEFEIRNAKEYESGSYMCVCKHVNDTFYSFWSDEVRLIITGKSFHLSFISIFTL